MKATILGLGLATAAFAGSSVYLWNQLEIERVHSAQVEETTRELNARIAELEQARITFEKKRVDAANGVVAGKFGDATRAPPEPAATEKKAAEAHRPFWMTQHRSPTPAMQKLMVTQHRARTRRLYADVGDELGLSKEKTDKLIDLLTEQQTAGMIDLRQFKDPADMQRHYTETQRAMETAISDLLGPEKATALKAYQASMPARMEFEMLERQMFENDAALTEPQRKQLLSVYMEERDRVPMPEYRPDAEPLDNAKANNSWKDDFEKRVGDRAGNILDSTQLAAYNDIQQGQKEMRDHFAVPEMMPPAALRGQRGVGIAGGSAVTYSSAAPAYGVIMSADAPVVSQEAKKP